MSSVMRPSKQKIANNLLVLEKTKTIREEDLIHPEWAELLDDYKEYASASWDEKALLSMVNAIVFHRRVFFVLSRDNFGALVRGDKNWKRRVGMKNSNWSKFLLVAVSSELIRCVKKPSGRAPGVFEVINKDLLSWIQVDFAAQKRECLEYVESIGRASRQKLQGVLETPFNTENLEQGDRKGDRKGDDKRKIEEKEKVFFGKEDLDSGFRLSPKAISHLRAIRSHYWKSNAFRHTALLVGSDKRYASPLASLLYSDPAITLTDTVIDPLCESATLFDEQWHSAYQALAAAIPITGLSEEKLSDRVAGALKSIASVGLPLSPLALQEVFHKVFGPKPSERALHIIRSVTNTHDALAAASDADAQKTESRKGPARQVVSNPVNAVTRGVLDD